MRHFVLVHGTFASKALWTQEGSFLFRSLQKWFPDAVIERFTWSGRNRINSRFQAALELRRYLRAKMRKEPDSDIYIIAHSHGGTVALKAADCDDLSDALCGIVCMSTPFVNIRRPRHREMAQTAQFFALFCLFFLPILAMLFVSRESALSGILVAAMLSGVVIGAFAWWFVGPRYAKGIERIRQRAMLPNRPATRVLLIRTVADEASGALIGAQFAIWILERIWNLLDWPRRYWQSLDHPKRMMWAALRVFAISGIAVTAAEAVSWFIGFPSLSDTIAPHARVGTAIVVTSFFLVIVGVGALIGFTFFMALPISLAIGAVLGMAIGREMLWAAFDLEVSVDPTPLGSWNVVNVEPPERKGMMHSRIYNDVFALEAIHNWLDDRPIKGPFGLGF
jgi:hypothetical protein